MRPEACSGAVIGQDVISPSPQVIVIIVPVYNPSISGLVSPGYIDNFNVDPWFTH